MQLANSRYDVIVVGSGPAGAMAALTLAKQGLNTAIVEKAALPRYKTCGGGLTRRALHSLPIEISAVVERECYQAELHLSATSANKTDRHFITERAAPIVVMTMRADFDHLIVKAAQAAGAQLLSNCEVTDLSSQADYVELLSSIGKLRASFVIAADGVMSLIARKSNWPDTRYLIPALECEITVNNETFSRFNTRARFDFGVVPNGYGWIFPKRSHLSIGLLTMQRQTINLNKYLSEYLKLVGINDLKAISHHGALIPVKPRNGLLADNRILLTGDVAGLADPITAEGISHAIISGKLAADAICTGQFHPAQVSNLYQTAIEQQIMPELRLASRLAKLLYFQPGWRELLFRFYGQRLCEAVTDLITGERSYQSILYNPLNYLKLLGIRKPRPG